MVPKRDRSHYSASLCTCATIKRHCLSATFGLIGWFGKCMYTQPQWHDFCVTPPLLTFHLHIHTYVRFLLQRFFVAASTFSIEAGCGQIAFCSCCFVLCKQQPAMWPCCRPCCSNSALFRQSLHIHLYIQMQNVFCRWPLMLALPVLRTLIGESP